MRPEKIEFLDHFSMTRDIYKAFWEEYSLLRKNIGSLSSKKQEEYNCLKLYFLFSENRNDGTQMRTLNGVSDSRILMHRVMSHSHRGKSVNETCDFSYKNFCTMPIIQVRK